MKERAFIDAVHRQLPVEVHRQSMTLTSMTHAGTPDYYYDFKRDLWVEYKSMSKDNHLPAVSPKNCIPTDLQQLWLNRRFASGGNVIVVVGVKLKGRAHGYILENPDEWSVQQTRESYSQRLKPVAEIAEALLLRLR